MEAKKGMINQIPLEELVEDVRNIYQSDSSKAEVLIEGYLEARLKGFPHPEGLALLERLAQVFQGTELRTEPETDHTSAEPETDHTSEELSRLFTLLLGERVAKVDLSSTELLEKLILSLNTIFDTLNQLVSVINLTLLGQSTELETIRQVIGSTLGQDGPTAPLKTYLDRIREAFFISHQSFKQAVQIKVSQILTELDPARMDAASAGGLKFGPLRKAELYEVYREKYQALKQWFEDGRFMKEFLREFERVCQKMYNEKRG